MKKKMLFMAAIAGLVSLGSCVKDDVSASVEAVRNAKANQLNGLANQANAQAALLNAQAATENATQAAQVAYEQALAAYTAAQADHEKADAINQELLNAAQELRNKLADESYAAQLEALLAQYAYTTADNKDAAQGKINALLGKIQAADDLERQRVAALITQFQTAYNNWIAAQNTVVQREVELEIAKISAESAASLREKQLLNYKSDLEVAQTVLDYILAEGQKGSTPAEIAAKIAIINSDLAELQLNYQNSAELPAFVKESNNFTKPYADYLVANKKIADDLAALNDATNLPTTSAGVKLFTWPAAQGGVTAVWDNLYDTNNIEAAAGTKYYASYVYLGAKTGAAPYVGAEIEQIKNPIGAGTISVNANGKFNKYAIAKADDIKAIKDNIKADSTAIEATYAAAVVAAGIGAPTDPANPAGSLYAKLNQAKLDESAASAAYTIAKATLDNDLLILASEGSTPTLATLTKVDGDYTTLYGAATVPASVAPADVPKWKASAASIAYRPNNAAGMKDFDLKEAKKATETAQKNLDTAIAALTIGDDTLPGYPAAGDTRNIGLGKVAAAKKVVAAAADDLAAYDKATAALTKAEESYNKAAKALMDVVTVATTELNAEKVALEAIYAENYEVALANQQVTVNQLKENIAKLEDVNPVQATFDVNGDLVVNALDVIPNPDTIIKIAEQNLEKAQMALVERYALLQATKKAIEESGIEYEIYDDDDDEPAEEPADEEPAAEEPAEGEGEEA
jgi:hypothetical protein